MLWDIVNAFFMLLGSVLAGYLAPIPSVWLRTGSQYLFPLWPRLILTGNLLLDSFPTRGMAPIGLGAGLISGLVGIAGKLLYRCWCFSI